MDEGGSSIGCSAFKKNTRRLGRSDFRKRYPRCVCKPDKQEKNSL